VSPSTAVLVREITALRAEVRALRDERSQAREDEARDALG